MSILHWIYVYGIQLQHKSWFNIISLIVVLDGEPVTFITCERLEWFQQLCIFTSAFPKYKVFIECSSSRAMIFSELNNAWLVGRLNLRVGLKALRPC